MSRPFQFAAVVTVVLAFGFTASAQRGGGHISGHSAGIRSSSRSFSSGRTASVSNTTPGLIGVTPTFPGPFRFNPPIFNRRGSGLRGGSFVPILWGGVPYYNSCLDPNDCYTAGDQDPPAPYAAQPAPQVIVVQQPAPVAPPPSASQSQNVAPAHPPSAPAPSAENTGFVLMRRSGGVIFASGYSVIGSNVRYITPEGIVRTIPLSELDMDSTRSMNEARGVAIAENTK